jgi:hypothetical protein
VRSNSPAISATNLATARSALVPYHRTWMVDCTYHGPSHKVRRSEKGSGPNRGLASGARKRRNATSVTVPAKVWKGRICDVGGRQIDTEVAPEPDIGLSPL